MIVCPGCGARNEPTARVCDWCARPFYVERHQIPVPWLAPAAIGAIVLLAAGTIIAAIVGAQASSGREAVPSQLTSEPGPIIGASTPEPTASSTPGLPSGAEQEEFVRIANTGGTGAFLRQEPRLGSPGVVAHRDGTLLRVVGVDITLDGRVWREVEDSQGRRGWTPREFLLPTDNSF